MARATVTAVRQGRTARAKPQPSLAEAVAQVSVIVAARNAQATIARAVLSALDQIETYEVIVVDDASSDATAAVAQACDPAGERVRVIRLAKNLGPAGARNEALRCARAPLVTILDADDFMLPGRLGELVTRLGRGDFVADDLSLSMEDAPLQLTGRLIGLTGEGRLNLERFAYGNQARAGRKRREMGFLKPLIRRSFLERTGLRYDPDLRLGEDFIFYARALALGADFRLAPACGYVAVARDGSLSHSHRTADLQAFHDASVVLAADPSLDGASRRALQAHVVGLRRRLTHRRALDVRQEKGLMAGLAFVLRRPADAAYVLGQTLRDKLAG